MDWGIQQLRDSRISSIRDSHLILKVLHLFLIRLFCVHLRPIHSLPAFDGDQGVALKA